MADRSDKRRKLAARHQRKRRIQVERLEARHLMATDLLADALMSDFGALDLIEFTTSEVGALTTGNEETDLPEENSLGAYLNELALDVSVVLDEATAESTGTPITEARN